MRGGRRRLVGARHARCSAPGPLPTSSSAKRCSRRCSICSPAGYPSEEFRESCGRASCGIAPLACCVLDRARGRLAVTNAGTHSRPGPVRGVHHRRVACRRARREEMVYEARVWARRSCWGASDVADCRDHLRPGRGHARSGRAGARCRSGTATDLAARSSWGRAVGGLHSHGRRRDSCRPRIPPDAARCRSGARAAVAARRGDQTSPGNGCTTEPDGFKSRRADRSSRRAAAAGELSRPFCRGERAALPGGAAGGDGCGARRRRTIVVVERFRDEIGDWRICILTPFGARGACAPWGIALQAKLAEQAAGSAGALADGMGGVELLWSDDGIVLRLPDVWSSPDDLDGQGTGDNGSAWSSPGAGGAPVLDATDLALDPDEVREAIVSHLPSTALFAVPLPGSRGPGAAAASPPARRTGPAVAAAPALGRAAGGCGQVPRASRCCSRPPGSACKRCSTCRRVSEVLSDIRTRKIRMVTVDTDGASPMAPKPAVRLDLGVHVRRRCAPGRAPGRSAGARPRPAGRLARRRGTARNCSMRKCSRPSSWSCSGWPTGAGLAAQTSSPTC